MGRAGRSGDRKNCGTVARIHYMREELKRTDSRNVEISNMRLRIYEHTKPKVYRIVSCLVAAHHSKKQFVKRGSLKDWLNII